MNDRRHFLLLGGAAAAALLCGWTAAACSKSQEQPADPVWGKEPCAHCAMLVSDKRFAGQVVANGDRKFFDDIGCMVLWIDENSSSTTNRRTIERSWVRSSTGWIDAKSAHYVEGAKTPMDFGFEAKSSPSDGDSGGVAWNEMRERVVAKKKKRGAGSDNVGQAADQDGGGSR